MLFTCTEKWDPTFGESTLFTLYRPPTTVADLPLPDEPDTIVAVTTQDGTYRGFVAPSVNAHSLRLVTNSDGVRVNIIPCRRITTVQWWIA